MKSLFAALLTMALYAQAALAADYPGLSTKRESPSNAPFAVGMYRLDQEAAIKLLVTNTANQKVMVQIKNEKGQIVYTEVVRNYDNFGRKYVLSGLAKGAYTIEISNQNSVIVQQVTL